QREEDAPQRAALVCVDGRTAGGGALERDRRPGLEIDEEVDERLAHERVRVDAATPLLAMRCVDGRFEERPAMDAESHQRDTEATAVDHLHHAVEPTTVARRVAGGALTGRARQPGARSVE